MQDILYILRDYLSPELIFSIPVLIVLGNLLKKSNRIADSLIPTILSVVGIPVALVVSLANKFEPMTPLQLVVWIMMGIGQGVFLGTAAVGVHQLLKQHQNYQQMKTWEEKESLKEEVRKELEAEPKNERESG